MHKLTAVCALVFAQSLFAAPDEPESLAPVESLKLLEERPVDGMTGGNLSGLAWCNGALWGVSDRDDQQLYRFQDQDGVWQAEAEPFVAPPAPDAGLPWGMRTSAKLAGFARGGELDFEGVTCDTAGNRYLVSESTLSVLHFPPEGEPQWLDLPAELIRQARASGMLLQFNSLFEGLAVDPAGGRLYLAAERKRRGVLVLFKQNNAWRCVESCVLFSEGGSVLGPLELGTDQMKPRDFSDLAFFDNKLFTLERQTYQICRRDLEKGQVERCWSFADEGLTEPRRYSPEHGMAEALWVDETGAWIGIDNGSYTRADGETRPIIWRFAAPEGGWSSVP
ncbi:esterase-like activity of phytase family protein [Pseudomonas sp. TTU2014-080ASC]|uniref:esterase-like activity of phytase family protein n=1 Tax=Pseudomonas sp. TTU2014-080ASC TaxID=1729724 RepID=UPI0007188D17|nr:esterase-like activity of phytase family protein [Pseudomonas sp. TTU2014-080ASC]KRW57760.1 DNA topoisomerase IV [Pseudomonas sp. TTU2014-080ASC]